MSLTVDLKWQLGTIKGHASFTATNGITVIMGKSGAGKTSLARAVCGLDSAEGILNLGGRDISNLKPQERSIGLVMQKPALFPTMSVEENILLSANLPQADIDPLIDLADIRHLLTRPPQNLSGGEAKRVALIRAIAAGPELLILDEPLTGLDTARRNSMLSLIKNINRQRKIPMLFITHLLDEMIAVADHAVLMDSGKTVVSGSLTEILSAEKTYEALGLNSALSIVTAKAAHRENKLLAAQIGEQTIWIRDEGEKEGSILVLRILASDVAIATSPVTDTSIQNILAAEVTGISPSERSVHIECRVEGSEDYITSQITNRAFESLALQKGQAVYLLIKAVAIKDVRNS